MQYANRTFKPMVAGSNPVAGTSPVCKFGSSATNAGVSKSLRARVIGLSAKGQIESTKWVRGKRKCL